MFAIVSPIHALEVVLTLAALVALILWTKRRERKRKEAEREVFLREHGYRPEPGAPEAAWRDEPDNWDWEHAAERAAARPKDGRVPQIGTFPSFLRGGLVPKGGVALIDPGYMLTPKQIATIEADWDAYWSGQQRWEGSD